MVFKHKTSDGLVIEAVIRLRRPARAHGRRRHFPGPSHLPGRTASNCGGPGGRDGPVTATLS
jgi:hypothetical protein